MHRVELKADMAWATHFARMMVPNTPCGIEKALSETA